MPFTYYAVLKPEVCDSVHPLPPTCFLSGVPPMRESARRSNSNEAHRSVAEAWCHVHEVRHGWVLDQQSAEGDEGIANVR